MSLSRLHHSVAANFPDELSIVGVCDVLDHDHSWQSLYQCFKPFESHVFGHNERFLILHHDTDYYPSMDSCGNTIYNIVKICAELDISTDHILILSAALGGLAQEVAYQCMINNLSPIKTLDFSLWYTWPIELAEVTEKFKKQKLFSCLNGVPRTHRKTLMALLNQTELLEQGIVSWNPDYSTQTQIQNHVGAKSTSTFRITDPVSRINEELSICPESKLLHVQYQSQLNISIKSDTISGTPNSWDSRWIADYLQDSLVYVVSETVGQYPHVYLSEKTWKAMMSLMPFMILGAAGTLAQLQRMGFLTFSNFWDESYDLLPTLYQRAQAIVNNLQLLKNQNLELLYQQIRPILLHNRHHIKTVQEFELDKIKNIL
jgi:hypothetical protein